MGRANYKPASHTCAGGGIGRHAGFRFLCFTACGFDSRPAHLPDPLPLAAASLVEPGLKSRREEKRPVSDELFVAAVADVLARAGDDGLSTREIAHALGGTPISAVRAALRTLTRDGRVARLDADLYATIPRGGGLEGRLVWRGGRYELRGDDDRLLASVPAVLLNGAIAGDRVGARVVSAPEQPPVVAEVETIVEPAPRSFRVVPHWLRGVWLAEVPHSREPVALGMGGRSDLREGQSVDLRLTGERRHFPQLRELPGRLLMAEVAGRAPRSASPSRDPVRRAIDRIADARHVVTAAGLLDRVAASHLVDVPFPVEAVSVADAAREPTEVGPDDTDLTGEPLVTIDGETAKDFDDAVSARVDGDCVELLVAIADVSAYVPLDGALDLEARRRGCSVYLPGRVYPMLPPSLSDNVCSLRPDVLRRCAWVRMRLGPEGDVLWHDAGFGVMRSRARLTYTRVQRALDGAEALGDAELEASLLALEEVRRRRYALRRARGMLDLDLPEVRAELSPDGVRVLGMHAAERLTSHRLIEECMLVANETVADLLAAAGLPAIRRTHGDPTDSRLEDLRRTLDLLEIDVRIPSQPTVEELDALLTEMAGDPRGRVLAWRVLRTMPRAQYSVEDLGHFGVGARRYVHFTSPIRRYPDLEIHRMLRIAVAARRSSPTELRRIESRLRESASAANIGEERSVDAERDAARVLGALYMQDRIGETFDALVSDVTRFGVFVSIDEPRLDGLIPFKGLGDERFVVVEEGCLLEGSETGRRLRIGDTLRVRCVSVDVWRGRVAFEALRWGEERRGRVRGGARRGAKPQGPPVRRRRR